MPKLPFISDSNIDSAIEHVTSALDSLQVEKERIFEEQAPDIA